MKDDLSLYKKAKEFFDKVKDGNAKAIILESVIAECIYVLTKIYKVPKDSAVSSLIDILHYKGIANDDQNELISALTLYANHGIDIVDCILCEKAKNSDNKLFSFDVELNNLAEKRDAQNDSRHKS
jgi:predicted nucleic-acid-binding protein